MSRPDVDAAVGRLRAGNPHKDDVSLIADHIEDLQSRIEAAEDTLRWFRQPAFVGTKTFDVTERALWQLAGEPDGTNG